MHSSDYTFEQIIRESEKIKAAKNLAQRAARTSSTVLIMGVIHISKVDYIVEADWPISELPPVPPSGDIDQQIARS